MYYYLYEIVFLCNRYMEFFSADDEMLKLACPKARTSGEKILKSRHCCKSLPFDLRGSYIIVPFPTFETTPPIIIT